MVRISALTTRHALFKKQGADAVPEGEPLPPDDRAPAQTGTLDSWYRSHRARMLRFIRRRTARDGAEDLTQHIFTRMSAIDAAALDAVHNPVAYLHRTADNLLKDEAKRHARHRGDFHVCADELPLTAPDQLAALEARDMLRRVEDSLLRLSDRTREIFLAHRIDGFSYAEIAGRTGLSVKSVEKHMSRAIVHLNRTVDRR